MIEIKTKKNSDDDLHYVVSWRAIPKALADSDPISTIHYYEDEQVPSEFYKDYYKFYIDAGFICLHPHK